MEYISETSQNSVISAAEPDRIDQIRYRAQSYRQRKPVYFFFKRSIDVVVALLLVLVLMPLFIVISIAIKIDSNGPVLIRQRRIGKNRRQNDEDDIFKERRRENLRGQPFVIFKFRSMHVNSKLYDVKPARKNDSRVTRIGRFLRRSCMDELPQLINVIRGDMSLVGPRPELPFIVKQYNDYQALRLESKPGITGLWQLYGSRERHIHEDVHLDLEYIQKQSFRMDMRIFLNTLKFALRMKNH